MNPTAVVYVTKTGHSKMLATAIAQALGTVAQPVSGATLPQGARLLFLVGGIYAGKSDPALLRFAETLSGQTVPKAVLVTSSVSIKHRAATELRRVLAARGVAVLDELTCTGGLLFLKANHPNADDAAALARDALRIRAANEAPQRP